MVALAAPGRAQDYIARADSMFRSGMIFQAETLYYSAVRRQTREPAARLALGRYFAARGQLRPGAVLMEEARYFGGDAKTIAIYLAPVYFALGDWRALAALPGTPLPYADRARAEWLSKNAPGTEVPDSATVPWTPSDSGGTGLGRVTLVLGTDTLSARIDPGVPGLVLDTAWVRRKQVVKGFASSFENDLRNHAGVALRATLGEVTLINVPTRFEPMADLREARLGLHVLAKMVPTFDATTGTILLRSLPKLGADAPGEHVPTLTYASGIWLVRPDGVWPLIADGELHPVVRGARWTLNPKRGEIIVAR
jgi:hypothetical protein